MGVERRYHGAGMFEAASIKIGEIFAANEYILEQDVQVLLYRSAAMQLI